MGKIKRELRTVYVGTKIKPSTKEKMVKRCEELEITMSDYVNRLILKDVK